MKRTFAFLLVLCMVIGLVACGKPADNTGATDPTASSAPAVDPNNPYNGKNLQIWGLGTAETYTDYSGGTNFMWMIKAAIEEWAYLNGVTLTYKGNYNQNQLLAAMNSGDKPDVIFYDNQFPAAANYGIFGAFTDEEYQKLSDICGKGFLDVMNYKNRSYGIVYPWTGYSMLYFNRSMFERYGVKNPEEYFLEGNWTWETFAKCMEEMTRDLDADGEKDTYGLPVDSAVITYFWKEDENGKLVSTLEEQYVYDYLNFRYEQLVNKGTILSPGRNQIATNVTFPMCAMQISDAYPYSITQYYQTLSNGDELSVVPSPAYSGTDPENRNYLNLTQQAVSLASSCDEREAVVDMLAYLMKCGMKYLADNSLGAEECEYEGIIGACDLSKQWNEHFAAKLAERAETYKDVEFNQELYDKIYEYFDKCQWVIYRPYAGVTSIHQYKEVNTLPPASSIPAIKAKYEASLQKYNDLYIFD